VAVGVDRALEHGYGEFLPVVAEHVEFGVAFSGHGHDKQLLY